MRVLWDQASRLPQPQFLGKIPSLQLPQPRFTTGVDTMQVRFGLKPLGNDDATTFLDQYNPQYWDRIKEVGYTCWDLYAGRDADGETSPAVLGQRYEEAENRMVDFASDTEAFTEADRLLKKTRLTDPLLARQVGLFHAMFLEGNVDPGMKKQLIAAETNLTKAYNAFRSPYRGKRLPAKDVLNILQTDTDPKKVEDAWKGAVGIGQYKGAGQRQTVAQRVLDAVKLRNQFAQKAGYKNYFVMKLAMEDTKEADLLGYVDQVTRATDGPFVALRERMDDVAKARYGIPQKEVRRPWFMAGIDTVGYLGDIFEFDPNEVFKGKDPQPMLRKTAELLGTNVEAMVEASDLFPREGKSQHWFLFPLDTPTDIRSLGNVDPEFQLNNGDNMQTLLHEFIGHGIGYQFIDGALPPVLKEHHTLVTECDAMLMESLMSNPKWLRDVVDLPGKTADAFAEKAKQYQLANNLVDFRAKFLRIVDFEHSLYSLPEGELTVDNANKLWRQKSRKYLGVSYPKDWNEPDWAYKMHLALAPVYYQNYFLGQLMRAQVHAKIRDSYGNLLTKRAGEYIKRHRKLGQTHPWPEIVKQMTGKPMNANALKAEFAQLVVPKA